MGMYTEIYVNVDLEPDTPKKVIDTLKAIAEDDVDNILIKNNKWGYLFSNGSYYTPLTSCCKLTYDKIAGHYSFLGKGDLKNYYGEIEEFFEFINNYCQDKFIGYRRYEEDETPTIIYKK